jgi:hypothetical protein
MNSNVTANANSNANSNNNSNANSNNNSNANSNNTNILSKDKMYFGTYQNINLIIFKFTMNLSKKTINNESDNSKDSLLRYKNIKNVTSKVRELYDEYYKDVKKFDLKKTSNAKEYSELKNTLVQTVEENVRNLFTDNSQLFDRSIIDMIENNSSYNCVKIFKNYFIENDCRIGDVEKDYHTVVNAAAEWKKYLDAGENHYIVKKKTSDAPQYKNTNKSLGNYKNMNRLIAINNKIMFDRLTNNKTTSLPKTRCALDESIEKCKKISNLTFEIFNSREVDEEIIRALLLKGRNILEPGIIDMIENKHQSECKKIFAKYSAKNPDYKTGDDAKDYEVLLHVANNWRDYV